MSSQPAGAQAPEPETAFEQRSVRAINTVQAMFFVTAAADPGLVPRIVEPFAKLGLTPSRVHISSEDGTGAEISADVRVASVAPLTAHLIDKALRRIVGVRQVIAVVE